MFLVNSFRLRNFAFSNISANLSAYFDARSRARHFELIFDQALGILALRVGHMHVFPPLQQRVFGADSGEACVDAVTLVPAFDQIPDCDRLIGRDSVD